MKYVKLVMAFEARAYKPDQARSVEIRVQSEKMNVKELFKKARKKIEGEIDRKRANGFNVEERGIRIFVASDKNRVWAERRWKCLKDLEKEVKSCKEQYPRAIAAISLNTFGEKEIRGPVFTERISPMNERGIEEALKKIRKKTEKEGKAIMTIISKDGMRFLEIL